MLSTNLSRTSWVGLVSAVFLGALAPGASAATIIRDPNPPRYKLEIEPHLTAQYFADTYGGHGLGPGVRFAIPIVRPGFIKKLNNSVAISFGGDFIYLKPYSGRYCDTTGCYEYGGSGFWGIYSPVTMQWNFWLTDKWSVFGEPGVVLRSTSGDACDRRWGCRETDSALWWAFYAGARYHFSDSMSLTMRAGYPTGISVGLSIF